MAFLLVTSSCAKKVPNQIRIENSANGLTHGHRSLAAKLMVGLKENANLFWLIVRRDVRRLEPLISISQHTKT